MSGLAPLPPAGSPIDAIGIARRAARTGDPRAELARRLGRTDPAAVSLHASGREALRVVLRQLAERRGRREVVVPAYTCFSVPAAVVAAGLRVRLVDVDARGGIEAEALARTPLDAAAAVVVCNLFGRAEPVAAVREAARAAGAACIDDAAQSFGARGADGPAGGRGDVGVLSFGRGKPLSALGGGAAVWPGPAPEAARAALPRPAPGRARLKALAYDAALWPPAFGVLARLPWLHIGETRFEPEFARGGIGGEGLVLLASALERFEQDEAQRAREAGELAAEARARGWSALGAAAGEAGVYPRLVLRAPSAALRERALARLRGLGAGASAFYPCALADLPALRPHRCDAAPMPGAQDLAARILTLPTHGGLAGARRAAALAALAEGEAASANPAAAGSLERGRS